MWSKGKRGNVSLVTLLVLFSAGFFSIYSVFNSCKFEVMLFTFTLLLVVYFAKLVYNKCSFYRVDFYKEKFC